MTTSDNDKDYSMKQHPDPETSFLIGRALLEDKADDDTREAFERFKQKNGLSRRRNPLIISIVSTAVAACIAVLIALTLWPKGEEPNSNRQTIAQLGNVVYEAQPQRKYISISLGDKDIPLSKANNTDGIIVDKDNEIHVFNVPADNHDIATISVPQGQTAKVMLDDGTTIMLNADSRISFPRHFYKQGTREVKLEGEAVFDVTHMEDRPFIVNCDGFKTAVLGTKFDIHAYEGETPRVTLLEGRVSVNNDTEQALLEPEQTASIDIDNHLSIADADLDVVNGWVNGLFYYDGQTLREILAEVGRWYNVNVVFANDARLNEQLHLNADRSMPIDEVVRQIKMISTAKIRVTGKALIVE